MPILFKKALLFRVEVDRTEHQIEITFCIHMSIGKIKTDLAKVI